MDLAIQAFSPIFTPGTYMAMGASHYVFFKEIPIGSEYTMEAKIGAWGDKWYVPPAMDLESILMRSGYT